jgi:hypothetical protein
MYRYTIGQDQWECYSQIEIIHTEKYSKEEFLNICKEAFRKINIKDRKDIIECRGDSGAYTIKDILIKEYGFSLPNEIICHIHMVDLFPDNFASCEDCPKSYMLNGKLQCNNQKCEFRDFLNEV